MNLNLFLALLVPLVNAKLLRINEWYSFLIPQDLLTQLELNLFQSCEKLTIMVGGTRLRMHFDGSNLRQLDIDSDHERTPHPSRVIGGCREINRKSITLNITATANFLELHLDGQAFKRPKPYSDEAIRIALLQRAPCCVIRGVLRSTKEIVEVTKATTTTTRRPIAYTRAPIRAVSRKPLMKMNEEPEGPNSPPWTELVNREWSLSFIICATVIMVLMSGLSVFGMALFCYLLRKPRNIKESLPSSPF